MRNTSYDVARAASLQMYSGDLLLHLPTQYTDDLKSAIEVVSKTGLPDPNVSCSTPF
jgi:coproporphyrinogen III oxidase-like Fe-S oxidoreductase